MSVHTPAAMLARQAYSSSYQQPLYVQYILLVHQVISNVPAVASVHLITDHQVPYTLMHASIDSM
jgi:hypothetical protein